MESSSTQASTRGEPPSASTTHPSKPRDWYFIAMIVVTVVCLYFTLFPLLCLQGAFPVELIGGQFGLTLSLSIGLTCTAISGLITFLRWKNPIEKQKNQESDDS